MARRARWTRGSELRPRGTWYEMRRVIQDEISHFLTWLFCVFTFLLDSLWYRHFNPITTATDYFFFFSAQVDDLLARVTNTMGQHNAMSQMGYPSQSPGQQPSPAAASQATSSLINLPTSGPDVFNGISGGGGSGVEMPPFPTATLGSELESTHGGSQLPLIERRLRDKAAGEMGRHTRSGNANGGHSGGGSGVEMTGVPVGRLGGGRGGNEPQSALAAVAWRRILAFLAAHTDKAEQLEGLFGRADRDGDGTLTVHAVRRNFACHL